MGNAGAAVRVDHVMTLLECFDLHGCDRGSARHRYDRIYEPLFEPRRNEPLRILEIGIFRGAGIAAWLEYFPTAVVHGIDTFDRVRPDQVPILDDMAVFWWRQDSTAGVPESMSIQYDLIFDDGAHDPGSQVKTLRNYLPKCRGMYFIEDVYPDKYDCSGLFAEVNRHGARHWDLRTRRVPDSYLLEARPC